MLRNGLVLIYLFSINLLLKGQADSILALPENIQVESLWNWAYSKHPIDSLRLHEGLQKMQHDFRKAKAYELEAESWWIWYYYLTNNYYPYQDTFAYILNEAARYAKTMHWQVQLSEIYIHKGLLYLNIGRPVAAFESIMAGQEIMREIGIDHIPRVHSALLQIGNAYLNIKDYNKAIPFLREAIAHPPEIHDPGFTMHVMNTIGICYMRMMEYDSALISYRQAHEAAKEIKDEFWIGLTGGNLGYVYYLNGELDNALPLLTEDFRVSVKNSQPGSAVNAALSLASIHLKKGNREEAKQYVDYFTKYIDRNDDHAMKVFFENLYLLEKLQGNFRLATNYADSAKVYRERYDAKQDKTILERARLQLEMARHTDELHSLESMRKRQVLIRNMLLAFTLLGGIILFLVINRYAFKRKKELELAQAQLIHITNTVHEKNELIDSFTGEIEKMRASEEMLANERQQHHVELMEAVILTEEDWKHFKTLFDHVHPGFLMRLKNKMPDVTPAETRLLALTKLRIATREMASMLGISYESIKKTRQRLRRKINLPEDGSLEEVADMI